MPDHGEKVNWPGSRRADALHNPHTRQLQSG